MIVLRRRRPALAATAFLACAATALVSPLAAPAALATAVPDTPVSHLVLQPGTDASHLNVNWFTNAEGTEQVQIVAESSTVDGAFPAEAATFDAAMTDSQDREGLRSAKATVAGLEPETTYVYRVGSNEGGWSDTYEYTTRGTDDFTFLFYGDPQLGSGGSTGLGEGQGLEADAQGWYDTLATSTQTYADASFLYSAGDQIDGYGDDGELEDFLGDRDPQYDALLADDTIRSYPLAVMPGNHDDSGYTYDEFWNMPNDEDRNSWFEHNDALFVNLDANMISIETHMALGSATTDAERAAIMEAVAGDIDQRIGEMTEYATRIIEAQGDDAAWIIVGFHQSPYSQATHFEDPDVVAIRGTFAQTLSDLGVDLVLGGHDHIYTRTHLMEGNTPIERDAAPGDVIDQDEGQTMYITGTSSSGSKYYPYVDSEGGTDPALTHASTAVWSQNERAGYSNISVTGDTLTVTTHNTDDNSVVDDVTLVKTDGTTEPPPPGTEPGTDPGTEPAPNPGTEPGTNPGNEPGTDPKTEAGTGADARPVSEPETDAAGDESGDVSATSRAADGRLAATGNDLGSVLPFGALLLMAGAALFAVSRRKNAGMLAE